MRAHGLSLLCCLAMASLSLMAQSPDRVRFGVAVETAPGLSVVGVDKSSPAAACGLKTGDVIVACGGKPIVNFESVITWLTGVRKMSVTPKNSTLTVSRFKNGQWRNASPIAITIPADPSQPIGLEVEEGLRIGNVNAGSPAEAAGLKAGDFLTRFGAIAGPSFKELSTAIDKLNDNGGGAVAITFSRQGQERKSSAVFARRPKSGTGSIFSSRLKNAQRAPLKTPTKTETLEALDRAMKKIAAMKNTELNGVMDDLMSVRRGINGMKGKGRISSTSPLAPRIARSPLAPSSRPSLPKIKRPTSAPAPKSKNKGQRTMRILAPAGGDIDPDEIGEIIGELMEEGLSGEELRKALEEELGGEVQIEVESGPPGSKKKPTSRPQAPTSAPTSRPSAPQKR